MSRDAEVQGQMHKNTNVTMHCLLAGNIKWNMDTISLFLVSQTLPSRHVASFILVPF